MVKFETVSPEDAGLSSKRILAFIDRLEQKKVPMHSFQMLYKDQLLSEGYYAPYTKSTLHRMFSISKSITSLAIGFLEQEGKLSLSDHIVAYYPDKLPEHPHPWLCEMTIRDMLMMRTCHASTTYKLDMTKDWVGSFFTTPPSHPAGQIFHYDTSAAHVLCDLAERLSGKKLWDYFREKLAPLSLSENSYFLTDPFGVSLGGSGLVCLPSDLTKIAYFLEHKGILNGQTLLSPAYIETATSNLTATCVTAPLPSEACGYGYMIWQNQRGGYTCYGMGGQLMIFLPDRDFICITTADTQGMAGGNQLIYDALYEEILPYLGKEKNLGADPSVRAALRHRIDSLHIMPLFSVHTLVPGQNALSQTKSVPLSSFETAQSYQFLENAQRFKQMDLQLEQTDASTILGKLTLYQEGFAWPLQFGFDHLETGTFPKYEQKYAASAVWLDASTLYVRFHVIDAYVGSVHIQMHFDGDQVTLFLKKQEESLFQEFKGHLTGKKL